MDRIRSSRTAMLLWRKKKSQQPPASSRLGDPQSVVVEFSANISEDDPLSDQEVSGLPPAIPGPRIVTDAPFRTN